MELSQGIRAIQHVEFKAGERTLRAVDLRGLLGARLQRLPYVLRLLAENHLRSTGEAGALLTALDAWLCGNSSQFEFVFRPNRILMHDTTCTPAIADIAGLRDALAEAGVDPAVLSATLPVNVSVDHSVAVDFYGVQDALARNASTEFSRNRERYAFLKWASHAMDGVHVYPPGTGIMHTINLEQLATVLHIGADGFAHPEMLLGTDSHTPMINGIGVLGWGVGGLEAESVIFGETVSLAMPDVVGVHLFRELPDAAMATDLVLEVTHRLRELGVAGSFVEFFGPGVKSLSADARAVVANMAPEYGASTGFFAADGEAVAYLERTGRPVELTSAIEPALRAMGVWFDPDDRPHYNRSIEIDLNRIGTTIAGPRRPSDRCGPTEAQARVEAEIGRNLSTADAEGEVPDGAVSIAAITSCTNTSDPRLLIAAGLLAGKATELGLRPQPWVKTSLAPGSPAARVYLERAGLTGGLSALGFDIIGYGCTTCIGNSGPLPSVIEAALKQGKAICAVLSGNRNFPGRVHPKLDLGYLASPPLVVAYALKGDIKGNLFTDEIGRSPDGTPVYLKDIWPSEEEIEAALARGFRAADIPEAFAAAEASDAWDCIDEARTAQFPWNPASLYLRRPKFAALGDGHKLGRYVAKPLLVLGDDITTDHISPAGAIDPRSHAGKWLVERGADPKDLNVYAAYRGNWEVMLRGLFTNRLARNFLQPDLGPAETVLEDGAVRPLFEAADLLAMQGTPTVILAGERYGMGSSRDWAAKGVGLLGVRAVIARSFERIHRTNLIGMGILPVQIRDGFEPAKAGISAMDSFELDVAPEALERGRPTDLLWRDATGAPRPIACELAVETNQEAEVLRSGGILAKMLRAHIGD